MGVWEGHPPVGVRQEVPVCVSRRNVPSGLLNQCDRWAQCRAPSAKQMATAPVEVHRPWKRSGHSCVGRKTSLKTCLWGQPGDMKLKALDPTWLTVWFKAHTH